jgi:hypothetical protein
MKLLLLIVGWAWIALGVWWFFRPAGIKRRFEKRYRKGARSILFAVLFVTAGILIAAGRWLGGLWGWLLAILGIIAVLKALLFVRGKVSDTVLDWWSQQPIWVYRVSAAVLFVLGCLIQLILSVGNSAP